MNQMGVFRVAILPENGPLLKQTFQRFLSTQIRSTSVLFPEHNSDHVSFVMPSFSKFG